MRTVYAGGADDFMRTPLNALAGQIAIQIGKVFYLDDIVEAHRCMEENMAGGKIVVLAERRARKGAAD